MDHSKYIQSQVMAVVKPGCPACEQTKPHLAPLKKMKQVRFAQIDVDKKPEIVDELHITAFPEVVYKDRRGQVFKMPWDGIPTSANIINWVNTIQKRQPAPKPSDHQASKNAAKRCTDCGEGVDPSIWGPALWYLIHMQALMYSSKPTQTQRRQMIDFFVGLADVLPCQSCANHYKQELASLPPNTFDSRDTLFAWTVHFHNKVSARTKNPQPQHTVAFWKRHYKKQLMHALSLSSNKNQ